MVQHEFCESRGLCVCGVCVVCVCVCVRACIGGGGGAHVFGGTIHGFPMHIFHLFVCRCVCVFRSNNLSTPTV